MDKASSRKDESEAEPDQCLKDFKKHLERAIKKPEFFLQVIGLIVVTAYTMITGFLWHDTGKNFAAAQRSWVGVRDVRIEQFFNNGDYIVDAIVSNSGKEPAYRAWFWNKSRLSFDPGLGDRKTMDDGTKHLSLGSLPPDGPRNMRLVWKWKEWQAGYPYVANQKGTISNYGEIVYYDGDGVEHRTQFCFYMRDAGLQTQRVDFCNEFNDAW
jgi:hypothetical protein